MTTQLIAQSWESRDGAAIDLRYLPEENPGRPVRVDLLSEDDGEFRAYVSLGDLDLLGKTIISFMAQVEGKR